MTHDEHDDTVRIVTVELTVEEAETLEALLKSQISVVSRRIREGRQKRDAKFIASRSTLTKVSDALTSYKADEIISGSINDTMLRLVVEMWSDDSVVLDEEDDDIPSE
jgi:hypothetical protein